MTDIVERLRTAAGWAWNQDGPAPDWDDLLAQAADEIERRGRLISCYETDEMILESEIERLRARIEFLENDQALVLLRRALDKASK